MKATDTYGTLKNVSKWVPLIIYSLLLLFLILLTPESIYFSKTNTRSEADTILLVIVFILPLIFVPFFYPSHFLRYLFGFVAFGFFGYLLGTFYRNKKIDEELKTLSTTTIGIVTNKKYFNQTKGGGHWEFFCEFEYGDFVYSTFYENDMKNKIIIGDSLKIKFLKRNPEISKISLPENY